MGYLAFFIGALFATALLSRLLLLITRSWRDGGVARLLVCNGASLAIASFLAGMGMADGGAYAGAAAFIAYAPAQIACLLFDVWRWRRRRSAPAIAP